VPLLGLLNPRSGALAGSDILEICRRCPYYKDRFFSITDVVKDQYPGGQMDAFRAELCRAKDEARALRTRPRLVSGGGDGTGSFALFVVFLALRAGGDREERPGTMPDTGNGFVWTDEELAESFPALAQMPLGSANDFANILGWDQKYPGRSSFGPRQAFAALCRWFEHVLYPGSGVVSLDVWGIVPPRGQEACDFRIAELAGDAGRCPNRSVNGKRHIQLKEAGMSVPFFVCLYFSAGLGAYMTARFQLNRHDRPIKNRLEYIRQAIGAALEHVPPQMNLRLEEVEFHCEGAKVFPPRSQRGRAYREAGFFNINWQAHLLHGGVRMGWPRRCCRRRQPVQFNDGMMDVFRWKLSSFLRTPSLRILTDRKKELNLRFHGEKGTGLFFQWDGEARFAFSPTGEPFNIFIRQVLSVPVVLGPYHNPGLTGLKGPREPACFKFCGDAPEDVEQVRQRVLRSTQGELDQELNGSAEDIDAFLALSGHPLARGGKPAAAPAPAPAPSLAAEALPA